jgi:hypothetical protein
MSLPVAPVHVAQVWRRLRVRHPARRRRMHRGAWRPQHAGRALLLLLLLLRPELVPLRARKLGPGLRLRHAGPAIPGARPPLLPRWWW